MPATPYYSDALYDYGHHSSSMRSSKSTVGIDWYLGLYSSATTADEKAILKDPALEPIREPHRITSAGAIKLVQHCLKLFLSSINEHPPSMLNPSVDKLTYPFEIFNHIDKALFSGVLKGNVYLKWEVLQNSQTGRTTRAGLATSPRISVTLSDNLRRGSSSLILRALIHQMIHAYLLQCCDYRPPKAETNGHDLSHGLEYSTISYLVQRALLGQKNPRCPAYLGCSIDSFLPTAQRNPMKRQILLHPIEAGSSSCGGMFEELTLDSIKAYNMHVKNTTPTPTLKIQDQSPLDDNKIPRYAFP